MKQLLVAISFLAFSSVSFAEDLDLSLQWEVQPSQKMSIEVKGDGIKLHQGHYTRSGDTVVELPDQPERLTIEVELERHDGARLLCARGDYLYWKEFEGVVGQIRVRALANFRCELYVSRLTKNS